MIQPCTNEHAADSRYRPSVNTRIRAIASKSMPPEPSIFATMPLNSSVVAVDSTFGPTMLKMVEPTANTRTTTMAALKRPMKAISLASVPLRFFGFSPGIMRPPGPWPMGPRRGSCAWAFSCALMPHHLPILLAGFHQLLVRALAHDAAVVQHHDAVGMQHRRDALRHDDHGLAAQARVQLLAQRGVGLVVERREAVVEQVGARLGGQRAGDGQALALAARHVRAALRHARAQAFLLRGDELRRLGDVDGLPDAVDGHPLVRVGHVRLDGA